jgi:acyl-CoA reductase-like NAD-dependent aldehyde dehydrogenase
MLRFYAGMATALHGETIDNSLPGEYVSFTLKEPVGVVGAIIPWNGPLTASIWKIGPALATGCTVVLTPAEEAPLTPPRLAELCPEAGVPPGVVNVMPGYGETAGAALALHPDVDKVAFTGSHLIGQSIIRASAGNLKRVSLELGGKSPDIVFADADLDQAVPGSGMAVFANSGQICSAGTRLLAERTIYDEFVGRVADFSKTLRVGDGCDPETQVGPLVSEEQLKRVTGHLAIGRQEGAKPLSGGERLTDGPLAKGYFVPPGVRECPRRHADRPGRNLRPDDLRHSVHRHRGSDRARQQDAVRPGQRRVDAGRRQGAPACARHSRRFGVDQLLSGHGSRGAVRWLQDERLWPWIRRAAPRRVPERQVGLDQDRLIPIGQQQGRHHPVIAV